MTGLGWLALVRITTHSASLIRIGGHGHAAIAVFPVVVFVRMLTAVFTRTDQPQSRSPAVSSAQAQPTPTSIPLAALCRVTEPNAGLCATCPYSMRPRWMPR